MSAIENTIVAENNFAELIKDAVMLYEEVGGNIADAFAFASKLHGNNKKRTKIIQRTMHNLVREMSLVNS
jgi:hypothetical protein